MCKKIYIACLFLSYVFFLFSLGYFFYNGLKHGTTESSVGLLIVAYILALFISMPMDGILP